jgi:hypothetical protein
MFAIIFTIVCIMWLFLIIKMKNPAHTKNLYICLKELSKKPNNFITDIKGVKEWYINDNEKILIIKYDSLKINEEKIKKYL